MRRALRSPLAHAAVRGALVALVAACSSDGPTTPDATRTQPLDAGRVLTGVTLPSIATVPGAAGPMPMFTALGALPLAFDATRCTFDAAGRRFVCPTVTVSGLTTTLSFTALDAAGNAQDRVDRGTTAAIRYLSTANGTITAPAQPGGPTGTLTVAQRQEVTIRGLLGATHTVDGTSTSTIEGTIALPGLPATPVRLSTAQTLSGLVLPTGTAGRWPTAGSITSELTMLGMPGDAALTVRSQLTFDGSTTAQLTITGAGISQRCTINLAAPATPPVCTG